MSDAGGLLARIEALYVLCAGTIVQIGNFRVTF